MKFRPVMLMALFFTFFCNGEELSKSKESEDSIQKLTFPVKKPEIPFTVRIIVGENPKETRFNPRLRQVHKLSKYLPPSQTNALLWYLHKPASRFESAKIQKCASAEVKVSGQTVSEDGKFNTKDSSFNTNHESDWSCPLKLAEVNVIKNDISTALLTQHNELTEFPDHLIYMFERKCPVESQKSKVVKSVSDQALPKGDKKERKVTGLKSKVLKSDSGQTLSEGGKKECEVQKLDEKKTLNTKLSTLNSKLSASHWYHDVVWRDYCIQFLGQWMERWSSIESNQKIEETFKKALLEKGNSIAGTTLIACNNNNDRLSTKMQKYFKEMALKVSNDKSYGETSRITAFQVCAMNGLKDALQTIREIAKGRHSACLRMSAISALGQLGDSSDLTTIKKAAKSYDTRIRKAAYAALKRLNL